MKGTDLKDWQIDAAEKFLLRNTSVVPKNHEQVISMKFGDFVRAVAWYGQIRAESVEQGCPADVPGHSYVAGDTDTAKG